MSEVSTLRLYILRATYLLIAVGLGSGIWPQVLEFAQPPTMMTGVARSMLAAVTLMAALGIRYPLKLLPLLLFELACKTIWLLAVAYPMWRANQIDPDTWETVKACLMGWVIFPIAIPWRYVWTNYVMAPGDRWTSATPAVSGTEPALRLK
jgi:hypothetical protein